jgi:hypothetical protein
MDFGRIRRQQVLLRRLLEDGFDFGRALAVPSLVSITGDGAIDDLRQVRAAWPFGMLTGFEPEVIGNRSVLVRRPVIDAAGP